LLIARLWRAGGGMFGNDDQNQNSGAQAAGVGSPAGAPGSTPDVISSTPSAPVVPDPLAMPSAQLATDTAIDPALAQIKQQALQSLEPLLGHLDQTPDEKFKTLMMLIQASDNSKMLHEAYAAANQITDEKARAQALLDIVNEINYFAQQAQAKQQ